MHCFISSFIVRSVPVCNPSLNKMEKITREHTTASKTIIDSTSYSNSSLNEHEIHCTNCLRNEGSYHFHGEVSHLLPLSMAAATVIRDDPVSSLVFCRNSTSK